MKFDEEEVIINFLNKKASPEEEKWLLSWLQEHASHQNKFDMYQRIWSLTPTDTSLIDFKPKESWEKIQSVLSHEHRYRTSLKSVSFFRGVWKYAAACVVLVVGVYLMWYFFYRPVVFTTASNQEYQLVLPDGSKVWMNRNTRLSYSKKFNRTNRFVYLKGEAFFDVVKDPHHPFIIETNQTITEVVGTSFNLKTYAEDTLVVLSVETGKVHFSDKKKLNLLEVDPLYTATFSRASYGVVKYRTTDVNYLAWKTNRLVFKQSNLQYVIATLESYFNIKIAVKDKTILDEQFSALFDQPTFTQVAQTLEASLGISIMDLSNGQYLIIN